MENKLLDHITASPLYNKLRAGIKSTPTWNIVMIFGLQAIFGLIFIMAVFS